MSPEEQKKFVDKFGKGKTGETEIGKSYAKSKEEIYFKLISQFRNDLPLLNKCIEPKVLQNNSNDFSQDIPHIYPSLFQL